MKELERLVAAVGICALVVVVPVASGGQAASRQVVVRFVAVNIVENIEHDVSPKGWSAGDWFRSRMNLFNLVPQFGRPASARVGTESLTVRGTGPRSGFVRGRTYIPGGSVIVKGSFRLRANGAGFLWPVAGGTGRFAGAKGTLYINYQISPGSEIHVYRLSLPGD
jgi:hypothetical protein